MVVGEIQSEYNPVAKSLGLCCSTTTQFSFTKSCLDVSMCQHTFSYPLALMQLNGTDVWTISGETS